MELAIQLLVLADGGGSGGARQGGPGRSGGAKAPRNRRCCCCSSRRTRRRLLALTLPPGGLERRKTLHQMGRHQAIGARFDQLMKKLVRVLLGFHRMQPLLRRGSGAGLRGRQGLGKLAAQLPKPLKAAGIKAHGTEGGPSGAAEAGAGGAAGDGVGAGGIEAELLQHIGPEGNIGEISAIDLHRVELGVEREGIFQ
jgi:hypothetical protein